MLLKDQQAMSAAAIGDYFKTKGNENQTLQDLSHAVLGATLAYANGASAVGGALAGGGAELAAQIVTKQLYPDAFDANGKLQRDKLTPAQAANITALSSGIGALLSGVAGGTVLDAAVGGKVATNAVENNFLKHADASAMKKEFDQCSKKPGGCSDADYVNIRNKFLAVSRTNIAQVESCIQSGNVKCVSDLEGQAASRGEISTQLVGADYTIFTGKQDNVNLYGAVKGTASLFGSDVLQAQDIAKFRQSNCSGVSASACDGMVKEALNDRLARVGILTVAGMATPLAVNGMRGLRLPGGKGNATNGVQSSGAAANELYGADGKLIGVIDAATGKIATGQQIGSNAQPPRLSVSTGANGGVNLARVEVDVANVTKGSPEYSILNAPPPNSQVKLSNGTEFKTNPSGYVDEVTYSPSLNQGGRDARQTAVGKEGLSTDVGGRVQACSLGGTCDRFNLFPQDGNFNNSGYKRW